MATSTWRKASQSASQGQCVEVYGTLQKIRDSKNPNGPELVLDVARLVAHVKDVQRP